MKFNLQDVENDFECAGFSVFEDFLDHKFLSKIRDDLDYWVQFADQVRQKNGLGSIMRGVAHQVLGRDDSMAEFIKSLPLDGVIERYFNGPYILNGYCGLMHLDGPNDDYAHVQNFHRDVRSFSQGYRLMLNMLVMVDDFTIENGATLVLPGSHRMSYKPSNEYLKEKSIYLTGSAGTIVLFDSNLWHAASINKNGEKRRALTVTYSRPFVKQQMDFVGITGESFSNDDSVKQVIGWKSRIPKSHSDWYQPNEKRFYHKDQG